MHLGPAEAGSPIPPMPQAEQLTGAAVELWGATQRQAASTDHQIPQFEHPGLQVQAPTDTLHSQEERGP